MSLVDNDTRVIRQGTSRRGFLLKGFKKKNPRGQNGGGWSDDKQTWHRNEEAVRQKH